MKKNDLKKEQRIWSSMNREQFDAALDYGRFLITILDKQVLDLAIRVQELEKRLGIERKEELLNGDDQNEI